MIDETIKNENDIPEEKAPESIEIPQTSDQPAEPVLMEKEVLAVDEAIEKPAARAAEADSEPARTRRPSFHGKDSFDKKGFQRSPKYKKKYCRFCNNKNLKVNYRDPQVLEGYITERGKILPRRITGSCSKHQRDISRAIKQARILSLLPFVVK